ncbi:ubiquitin-like domain-containing protein, partial [Haematococcus lacustris]
MKAECEELQGCLQVQARAADAGRGNVEAHYSYSVTAFSSFMERYSAQHAAHAQLLATFHTNMAVLEGTTIHASIQTERVRRLSDLSGAARARELAEACRKTHGHLAGK